MCNDPSGDGDVVFVNRLIHHAGVQRLGKGAVAVVGNTAVNYDKASVGQADQEAHHAVIVLHSKIKAALGYLTTDHGQLGSGNCRVALGGGHVVVFNRLNDNACGLVLRGVINSNSRLVVGVDAQQVVVCGSVGALGKAIVCQCFCVGLVDLVGGV